MQTTHLKISGMTCSHCAARVEKALKAVPGVLSATVDLQQGATVQHDGASLDQLTRAVSAAGQYRAQLQE
jgi:copper chaperone CopZ